MAEEGLTKETNEEPEVAEKEDIASLKQGLAEEKEKAERYLANWQRAQADFINHKRRSEQEKEDITRFANSALMLSLLPILDDLERALTYLPGELGEALTWVDGIRLLDRKLRTTLEAQGLSQIKALGEPFDPRFHEAVMQAEGEEGTIVRELQKGYTSHDRVIRPSRVVVGNGKVVEEKKEV